MDKLELNLKTALVILIGYAAHQSNPQYQFVTAESQANANSNAISERAYYRMSKGTHINGREAFTHWAQAYQNRLNQGELTAERK